MVAGEGRDSGGQWRDGEVVAAVLHRGGASGGAGSGSGAAPRGQPKVQELGSGGCYRGGSGRRLDEDGVRQGSGVLIGRRGVGEVRKRGIRGDPEFLGCWLCSGSSLEGEEGDDRGVGGCRPVGPAGQ